MKITVDTNILVSATFWYGDSFKILELVERKQVALILSPEIIEEFVKVLNYDDLQQKVKNKKLTMKRTVDKVIALSTLVYPAEKIRYINEDPDDNKFLECAKAGKVDFIVSRDNHLLKLKVFDGIQILSPSEFLRQIK